MSTKIERQSFQWKSFGLLYLLLAALLAVVYLLIEQLGNDEPQLYERIYWILVYPLIFASLMVNNFRRAQLTITEFGNVTSFNEKLGKRLQQFNIKELSVNTEHIVYAPKSWYKSLFNNWFSTELVQVSSNENVVRISAPIYRISQLEDTLTWNKDFKS